MRGSSSLCNTRRWPSHSSVVSTGRVLINLCLAPCPHLSLTHTSARRKKVRTTRRGADGEKLVVSQIGQGKESTCECAHVLGAQTASVKQGGTDNLASRSACHCSFGSFLNSFLSFFFFSFSFSFSVCLFQLWVTAEQNNSDLFQRTAVSTAYT